MTLDHHPALHPAARRPEIDPDGAGPALDPPDTALDAAARRLITAYDDYEDALDRGASLAQLQALDREVARAERAHEAVRASQAGSARTADAPSPAPVG